MPASDRSRRARPAPGAQGPLPAGYNLRMRLVRPLALAAGTLLGVFHLWLLAAQGLDGRLAEPELALRWVLAGGLVAALAAIRRSGGSLVGRRSVAVWVLAALLHGPAIAGASGAGADPAVAETVATVVLQFAAASSSTLFTLLLAALAWLRGRRPPARGLASLVPAFSSGALAAGFGAALAARPPPLR